MAVINREKAEAIIAQQVMGEIFQDQPQGSTFLSMARRLPNMTSNQTRMRVLDILPIAYWVNGDMGLKQTTEAAWDNVFMNAEELAVIVPIPEAVLDDAEFDIFGQVSPRLREAIYQLIDLAAIFDVGRPASWRMGIVPAALQAGNNVTPTSDLYADLLATDGVWDKIESKGYAVTGAIAQPGFKAKLRGLRTEIGQPLFTTDMKAASTPYAVDGTPLFIPTNGGFDTTYAALIVGDWTKAVYSIRQDVTVKILDQGVISDSEGNIIYNLPQQDMIALRVVFRMGWALPNPATRLDTTRVAFPFAYLEAATPFTVQTVTINVKDNANTPANVAGVAVEIGSVRKVTGSDGNAIFKLQAGSYEIQAKKSGYTTTNSTATVTTSPVSVNITLPIKA